MLLGRWSVYWINLDGSNETRISPPGRDFFTPAAFHTGNRKVAVAFQDANKMRCAILQDVAAPHPITDYSAAMAPSLMSADLQN